MEISPGVGIEGISMIAVVAFYMIKLRLEAKIKRILNFGFLSGLFYCLSRSFGNGDVRVCATENTNKAQGKPIAFCKSEMRDHSSGTSCFFPCPLHEIPRPQFRSRSAWPVTFLAVN